MLITVRHGFIQVLGRQAGHLIWLFDQTASIGERRQAQATAGFELNLVDGQPKGGEVVALQTEGITRFDNEQPRSIHGHDLHQYRNQGGRLAGAGRTEQQQVAIHGTVETRQRVERQRRTTTVEKSEARIAGADAASPQGQQVCDMLSKQ
ncbi:hypothetical protein D3C86_1370180 [compost metagenome]